MGSGHFQRFSFLMSNNRSQHIEGSRQTNEPGGQNLAQFEANVADAQMCRLSNGSGKTAKNCCF